jgi:DNA-binding transcriptional LysR family regulator
MDVLRLTLRQLQIFVAVAHCGSTTAASEQLALSQSATSAAVNELERLLSMRLFDRTGKRLQLNDNGRSLLPRAVALLDGAAAIERMTSDGSAQSQALRIGTSTTIGNYVLPRLLRRFFGRDALQEADSWQSRCTIANTEAICEALAAFELDIGLIEGTCHLPALRVRPWIRDDMVLVASPGTKARLLKAGTCRVEVRDLRELTWLIRERGSGTRQATDELLLPHLHAYRRSVELGNSEAIMRAAVEGLGIACLSHWVVADLIRLGSLCQIPNTLPPLVRQCYLVVHREKQATQALDYFIQVAMLEGAAMATAERLQP